MSLLQVYFLVGLSLIFNFFESESDQVVQENKPPVVKVKLSPALSSFKMNETVAYQIEVSDFEDGSTNYEEINPREIVLHVVYTESTDPKKKDHDYLENPAIQLLIKNGCLNCHSSRDKLIGPSFDRIAGRYQANPETIKKLTQRIKNGTSGAWGDIIMPSNPDVDEAELEKVLNWILQQKPGAMDYVVFGSSGRITFGSESIETNSKGNYHLTATYLDHGPGTRQRGTAEIFLGQSVK